MSLKIDHTSPTANLNTRETVSFVMDCRTDLIVNFSAVQLGNSTKWKQWMNENWLHQKKFRSKFDSQCLNLPLSNLQLYILTQNRELIEYGNLMCSTLSRQKVLSHLTATFESLKIKATCFSSLALRRKLSRPTTFCISERERLTFQQKFTSV